MEVVLYEKDKGFVITELREGEFDYVDSGDEVFETEFFRYIQAKKYLKDMAATYPTPRKKGEVPLWFYLASNLSMRLHGVCSFNQYSYVVRCGGMLAGLGPEVGQKVEDKNGDVKLSCPGFNNKNDYPRETPCDKDFLRKIAKDTQSYRLHDWFNKDVSCIWKKHKVYDRDGIFIGDASYIFVPDNENYEGSVKMLFDEHNHPVDSKKIKGKDIKAGKYKWRRCYKMVSLLHTDKEGKFFVVAGLRVVAGNKHESPVFYELLEDFVNAVGDGVVRRVILDRGFLDGERISHFKREHGIDFLIPVRKDMDIYEDAMGLLNQVDFSLYEKPKVEESVESVQQPPKPEKIAKREKSRQKTLKKKREEKPPIPKELKIAAQEVGAIASFNTWESCNLLLNIVFCRDTYGDGHQDIWLLIDTRPVQDPSSCRTEYTIRSSIEERHRQFKCFCDLANFTSRAFSLVLNQIMFILLTYNLIQIYLLRSKREELNRSPLPFIRKKLLPAASFIIVYSKGKFGFFRPYEFMEILLTLSEGARQKALCKTRKLRSEMAEMLAMPP